MQRIPQKEVWLAFGMGKLFRYYPIHEIARSLGPQKSLALPVFHAFTGCDTVSFFAGKSKKSAWDTWNVFPEVTSAFLEITNAPSELSEECKRNIEMFVVLLYDRGSQLKSVDEARKQLFCTRSRSLGRIPPTSAALKQHILRASYQGGRVWSQVHLALQELPSPAEWGWEWSMEPCVDNVATSPAKLLRADPLFLQKGLQRVVQVFKSKPSVYSSVCLWWRLLPPGKGQYWACIQAMSVTFCDKHIVLNASKNTFNRLIREHKSTEDLR